MKKKSIIPIQNTSWSSKYCMGKTLNFLSLVIKKHFIFVAIYVMNNYIFSGYYLFFRRTRHVTTNVRNLKKPIHRIKVILLNCLDIHLSRAVDSQLSNVAVVFRIFHHLKQLRHVAFRDVNVLQTQKAHCIECRRQVNDSCLWRISVL